MANTLNGTIVRIFPLRTGENWKVQEFQLVKFGNYPQPKFVNIELWGDRITQFPIHENDNVVVSFDVESRSFVGRDGAERFSTSVRAWKIEPFAQGMPAPAPAPSFDQSQGTPAPTESFAPAPAPANAPTPAAAPDNDETKEDLPF